MQFEIVFDSKNIYFVKITEDLINDYLQMVNDRDVSKNISLKDRFFTLEDEMNWIKKKNENNAIIFSMIEKSTNEFIGNIEIMSIENNIGELAICITSKKQGKHFGTEAINRFIEYCLNDLRLEGLELSVYSHNQKAINCYCKIGFVEYKRDKNVGVYENLSIDDIYMRLER